MPEYLKDSQFFLLYINYLYEGQTSNAKIFANDCSLFFIAHDVQTSIKELNKNLKRIHKSSVVFPIENGFF